MTEIETNPTTETTAPKTKRAAKAKAVKKPAAVKAKNVPVSGKAAKSAKVAVAIRPRGQKWEQAKELLTAKGGATKADLFSVLRWRSMDQNLLAKGTGLVITKLESGNYAGR